MSPPDFEVYEDNKLIIKDQNDFQQKGTIKNVAEFCVYTDEDDEAKYLFNTKNVYSNTEKTKNPKLCVDKNDENMYRNSQIPEVYIDNHEEKGFKIPNKYIDICIGKTEKETKEPLTNSKQVYCYEDSTYLINENKSPFKKVQNVSSKIIIIFIVLNKMLIIISEIIWS